MTLKRLRVSLKWIWTNIKWNQNGIKCVLPDFNAIFCSFLSVNVSVERWSWFFRCFFIPFFNTYQFWHTHWFICDNRLRLEIQFDWAKFFNGQFHNASSLLGPTQMQCLKMPRKTWWNIHLSSNTLFLVWQAAVTQLV